MRRIATTLLASALALGLLTAGAVEDNNLAANPGKCEEAGGTHSDTGENQTRVRTCTIESEGSVDLVPASHPAQAWKAEVTTPAGTDVHRLAAGEGYSLTHESGGGDPVLTGCFNRNGNPVDDWAMNKNCQPAS